MFMENEVEFNCPYCGELNYITVFKSDGKSQKFINDCEVCCRPIEVVINFDTDGNLFIEVKNDDGY